MTEERRPFTLELRDVRKRFGRVRALDQVALELPSGHLLGVLGANGAGKTTLLRCLAGLSAPEGGGIWFDGEELSRDRLDLRRRIGFVADFPALFPDQNAITNIGIHLNLFGAVRPAVEERVAELLLAFDILTLARLPVGYLSRGQSYKVALSALMATDPDVWLLDEPFASGMDPHGLQLFKQETRAAVERGRLVIYSTQILDVAERFSDRVCVLHKGGVKAFDSVANLKRDREDSDNVLEQIFQELREDGS